MFLETSRPISPGWKARLVSKYIGMRVACLKFWYHAFGDDAHMGELQLVVKTSSVGTVSSELYHSRVFRPVGRNFRYKWIKQTRDYLKRLWSLTIFSSDNMDLTFAGLYKMMMMFYLTYRQNKSLCSDTWYTVFSTSEWGAKLWIS